MARRALADDLVVLPWWVLLILAAIVYVTLKYIIPSITVANLYVQSLLSASVHFAWPLSLLIFFLAGISALGSWRKRDAGTTKRCGFG